MVSLMIWAHIYNLMNLNYDSILIDLKKAKSTILSLRQERDHLKDTCLQLEKTNRTLKKQLQDYNALKEHLIQSKQEAIDSNISRKFAELSNELQKTIKSQHFHVFFPEKKIREGLECEKYAVVVQILTDFVLEYMRKTNEIQEDTRISENSRRNRLMSSETLGEIEESEYYRLINESCSLIETLDKQNNRISDISRNITNVVETEKKHSSSRSAANIRVPEYTTKD